MSDASKLSPVENHDQELRVDHSADENQLRLLVGRNADYFLAQWWGVLRGRSQRCGFNKAAFFLAAFWLAYRRMYGLTLALWILIAIESVTSDFVFVEVFGHEESPRAYDRLVTLLIALCCGTFGNRWYYGHCRRKLQHVRDLGQDGGEFMDETLRNSGGTSLLGSIFVNVLGIGIFIGVFVIYALVMDAINGG